MKKLVTILILAIVASFTFSSCELNDDNYPSYHFELLPVESVDLPETFVMGQAHQIKVYYYRPTDCHSYEGFYYDRNLNIRTVAVQTRVFDGVNCQPLEEEPVMASFDFVPTNNGTYIFKFYHGEDEEGNNIFLEYEIEVGVQ